MKTLLLIPAVSFVLVAQAPNYEALKKDVQTAVKTLGPVVHNKAMAARKPKERPDYGKAIAGLRAKKQDAKALQTLRTIGGPHATGEQKEASLLAEYLVWAEIAGEQAPEDLRERVLKEVPPSAPGWGMASQELLTHLGHALGDNAKGYLQKMEQEGPAEARAALQSSRMGRLLDEGKMEEAKALIARLGKEFPGNPSVKDAARMLERELKTTVGSPAPAFSVPDIEHPSQTFTKDSFKGKYLLLDFWGTWCSWCVEELPNTHKAYAAFKDKGLEILSVAADKKMQDVLTFRKNPKHPMPWKHGFVSQTSKDNPILQDYGIPGFPSLYLLGPDGTLLEKGDGLRGEGLQKTLSKYLK